MLKLPDTDQMTSKGSAHDQFYLALESVGWARRAKLDDELDAIGLFAAWSLTPDGRTSFPGLLLGAQIIMFNEDYESRLTLNFAKLAVKFAIGYALAHTCALATVYGLTRMGVALAPVQDFLSLGLIFGSSAAGVYAAVTPWTWRQDPVDKLKWSVSFKPWHRTINFCAHILRRWCSFSTLWPKV